MEENPELALPRAFAVPTVRVVPDGETAWELLPELDFSREAIVEDSGDMDVTDLAVEEAVCRLKRMWCCSHRTRLSPKWV